MAEGVGTGGDLVEVLPALRAGLQVILDILSLAITQFPVYVSLQ